MNVCRCLLLFTYGTWERPSVSALMTFPSAERDRLIIFASCGGGGVGISAELSRSTHTRQHTVSVVPVAPVLPTISEPARSTRKSLPLLPTLVRMSRCDIVIVKTL